MSIFKLAHHSKAQNVASSIAIVSVWLEYQYIAFWKKSPKLQYGSHQENFWPFGIG